MAEDGAPKKTGGGVISAVFAAIGVGVAFIGAHVIPEIVSHLSSAFGEWLGLSLFLPIVILFLTCWAASKLLSPDLKFLNLALGVPAGQAAILILSVMILGSRAIAAVWFDVAVILAALIWFASRPSAGPIMMLLVYEIGVLAINFYVLIQGGFDETLVKGLISSIVVRIFAILVLLPAYKEMKSRLPGVSQTPGAPAT